MNATDRQGPEPHSLPIPVDYSTYVRHGVNGECSTSYRGPRPVVPMHPLIQALFLSVVTWSWFVRSCCCVMCIMLRRSIYVADSDPA